VTTGAAPRPALAAKLWEERTDPRTDQKYLAVSLRGSALMEDPILNKGTCFTASERDALGLRGLLPSAVSLPEDQETRSYENYLGSGDDVGRYLFLASLQDRNETLFYRLLLDHLEEMVPIVYTPTVGKVCERYSHLYRRPRGAYISTQDRGRMVDVLTNTASDDIEVIVVTDNEAILGIGDQGIGGMGIAIGKLALYTAGAGIHPSRGLPLNLDVGTDNRSLIEDPLYLGVRHARLRGDEYIAMLDELVDAISQVFPEALVQWEDFANRQAFHVVQRYRHRLTSFDDDIQGTGAIVEAGARSAVGQVGRGFGDQRIVLYGAGASGAGCALQLRHALAAAGVPQTELSRRVLCLDSQGLILRDRPRLEGYKQHIAGDPSVAAGWPGDRDGRFGLLDVVRQFKPTMLIGASGNPGAFTEQVVKTMLEGCARPIILPLSNPTSKAEAVPEDLLRWTGGAAVVGTGSPFAPVHLNGVTYQIGQANNVFAFPGIGLGASVVRARRIPDEAFSAAARAVYACTEQSTRSGASIYPPISRLRDVSRAVAVAVGCALVDAGAAPPLTVQEIEDRVAASMWEPVYLEYRPD
jgi:malate dehydrogenase (oxaloacetate-decarboxylating)